MKKIFSSILALAMTLSLCTFTAHAGTAGTYNVTYEGIGETDVANLKAGDMFWAVVTLKGAEGIFSGGVTLTWDNTYLQISNAAGAANKVFGVVTDASTRIVNTAKTTGMNMDTGLMEQVAALEANSQLVTDNSICYEFTAAAVYDENGIDNFNDYYLSGDTTIVKIRFKVLEGATAENAKLTCTQSQLLETKADGDLKNITMNIAPLSFASATPDPEPTTTTSYFGANVNTAEKPSLAQILVYTFTTDEVGAARNTATKEIDLGTANFDTPTTIKTAAKVSGIPDGVTVGCSVAWK